jgi:hypothetical protein
MPGGLELDKKLAFNDLDCKFKLEEESTFDFDKIKICCALF